MKTHRGRNAAEYIVAGLVIAIGAAGSGAHAQSSDEASHWSASANGPLTIAGEDFEPLATEMDGDSAQPLAALQREAKAQAATNAAPPVEAGDVSQDEEAPPSELMSLGAPATSLDAKTPLPVPGVSDHGSIKNRVLRMIDPRESEIIRVGGALVVVLGLIMLARVVLRRGGMAMNAGRPSGVLEILARYPVGRGQQLLLLKLARRVILVHASGGTMQTLSEVHDPDEVAGLLSRIEAGSRGGDAKRFREMLSQFDHEHDGGLLPPTEAQRTFRTGRLRASGGAISSDSEGGEVIDLTRRRNALFSAGILSRSAAG